MDDLSFRTRNKRGDWTPNARPQIAFFWNRPSDLKKWGSFLIGYVWPWNAAHMAVTLLYWHYVLPEWQTMKTISWRRALWLYVVYCTGIFILYGVIEFFYYFKRRQGARFKYNGKFPSEQPSDVFWFKSQNIDNFLRTFLWGISMWTLVEVLMLWCIGLVPVWFRSLAYHYAIFVSKAKGLMPPRYEWRLRAL